MVSGLLDCLLLSTVMFEIELVSFVDHKAADEFESFTRQERREATLEQLIAVANAEREAGNDFFQQNMIGRASSKYNRVRENCVLLKTSKEMYSCKQTNTYIYTHAHTYAHAHTHHTYICTHAPTHTHTHTHMHTHTIHTHAYTHTCTHTCTHTSTHTCPNTRTRTHTNSRTHTHMHTHRQSVSWRRLVSRMKRRR